MKSEEFGRALDALAGDDPSVDDAYAKVARRAQRDRLRVRVGAFGVVVCVVALATFGVTRLSDAPKQVIVQNPTSTTIAPSGERTDLTWTRVAAPDMTVERIVTADGKTFAVGSLPDGRATIAVLHAGGTATYVDPNMAYNLPRDSGSVNDLIAVPGALIAVGDSRSARGEVDGAAVWRSTDGGETWLGVPVETDERRTSTITRVLVSRGTIYAVGTQFSLTPDTEDRDCSIAVWKSGDGTDFRFTSAPTGCSGAVDAADGPAGLVITTRSNETAWTEAGGTWEPHSISGPVAVAEVSAVAGNDQGYVAIGAMNPDAHRANNFEAAIWWSPDGKSWSRVVTVAAPGNAPDRQAIFASVAHTAAGWVAVGWYGSLNEAHIDAIVWTSADGKTWTTAKRDSQTFEQYAAAQTVGSFAHGFVIAGTANLNTPGTPREVGDPGRVLWFGSPTTPSPPSTEPPAPIP